MFKLGNITFVGIKGFSAYSSTLQANLVQHALIENKPRLQRVGMNLEEINATIRLHVAFCNPEAELSKLYAALESSEILPLTNGEGDYFGKFVLESIALTVNKTDTRGRYEFVEANIKLLEALNPNDEVTSRANAFALSANRPPQYALNSNPYGDAARMVQEAVAVWTDTESVDSYVTATVANPDTATANLGEAAKRCTTMQERLLKIDNQINDVQSSIYNAATDLRSHMANVQGAVSVMQNACDTVNVVAADAANTALKGTMLQMRRYTSPIAVLKATRK